MVDKKDAKVRKPTKKAAKKTEVVAEVAPVELETQPEAVASTEAATKAEPKPEKTAKAGKRSAKAQQEADAAKAKLERKSTTKTASEKPKVAKKPPRSRAERAGKKYRELAKLIEKDRLYTLIDGLELATKTSPTKFDATVELHLNLGVDPKTAEQNIRGTVVLPAGSGKTAKVAVVADEDGAKKAAAAGADLTNAEEILKALDKGEIDFDVLVATPQMMPTLGKYAKVLGPKGLMPNPKSGTVAADVAKAVAEAKAGKVEYRVDSGGIIHCSIGKVSFGQQKLSQNAEALLAAVKSAKPSGLKTNYILSAFVTTSMGPSIKLDLASL